MKKKITTIIIMLVVISLGTYHMSQASILEILTSLGEKISNIFFPSTDVPNVSNVIYLASGTNGVNYTYDAIDRVTQIDKTDGGRVSYVYNNGNSMTETNERNLVSSYTYQSFGDPEDFRISSIVNGSYGTTSYEYDVFGNTTRSTVEDKIQTWTYNSKGFLTSESNPETGTITYTHDNVGNVKSRNDAISTVQFNYDELNRVVFVDYPGSDNDATNTYFTTWDGISSISTPSQNTLFDYYDDDKIKTKSYTLNGKNYVIEYYYNDMRSLSSMKYPSSNWVYYGYNNDGIRINSVFYPDALSQVINDVKYLFDGKVSEIEYKNGVVSTNAFDVRRRATNQKITSNSQTKTDLTYVWDVRDNLNSKTDSRSSTNNVTNTWDTFDRLTRSVGDWGTLEYTYNYPGDRLTEKLGSLTKTYNYNSTTKRLGSITGPSFSKSYGYNAIGNVSQSGDISLSYDSANRTSRIEIGNERTSYKYDSSGNRILKEIFENNISKSITLYHLDTTGNVLCDEINGIFTDYIYLNGNMVAKYEN